MSDKKVDGIQQVVDLIRKEFGPGACFTIGGHAPSILGNDRKRLSTGLYELDWAMNGGLVKGVMHEIYGNEGDGKTTLALHLVKEAQQAGMVVFYCDAEHSLNPEYAQAIGVNLKKMIISQPDYGEQGLDIIQATCQSGMVGMVVVDSVAALVPKADIDGDFTDANMGAHPRMMSKMCRVLTPIIGANEVILVLVNQTRQKLGMFMGNPETTTGGKGIKFYAGMRMRLFSSFVKQGEGKDETKRIINVNFIKQKWGPPYRNVDLLLELGRGFNKGFDRLNYGLKEGIVKQASSFYKLGNISLGNGKVIASSALDHEDNHKKYVEALNEIRQRKTDKPN